MPLIKSSSPKAFKENVRTLMHDVGKSPHVKSREQALAIAYSTQRRSKGYADGGRLPIGYQGHFHPMKEGGFIATDVPGRTDKHYVTVKEGSYVLPADHVSALGQNNSIAGAKVVKDMFSHGTRYGPRLKIPAFARGGGIRESDGVPVVVAGGEIILPPEIVRRIGNGDLKKGHESLDRWVLATRRKHIAKLKSLKPPKGSD